MSVTIQFILFFTVMIFIISIGKAFYDKGKLDEDSTVAIYFCAAAWPLTLPIASVIFVTVWLVRFLSKLVGNFIE